MYICITNIDIQTGKLCTEEPMKTGPSFPKIKGFNFEWANESTYPINCDVTGRYINSPLFYGICDDDADTTVIGVIETISETQYIQRKKDEFFARKPHASWIFDENTLEWNPPIPYPSNAESYEYEWNEQKLAWIKIT